jgi:hypothetical protein
MDLYQRRVAGDKKQIRDILPGLEHGAKKGIDNLAVHVVAQTELGSCP